MPEEERRANFEAAVVEHLAAGEIVIINPYSGVPTLQKFGTMPKLVIGAGPACPGFLGLDAGVRVGCGERKLSLSPTGVLWCFGCGYRAACPDVVLEQDVRLAMAARIAPILAERARAQKARDAEQAARAAKKKASAAA